MAQIHKLEDELVAKSRADKLFNMMTRGAPSLPKYIPQIIQKCQVLPECGEVRLGSIFVWEYVIEGKSSAVKEKITAVDHKNMSITYTVFEGELTICYPSLAITVDITPILGGGSRVKWSVQYEKENEHVPTPTPVMKLLEALLKELDAKLADGIMHVDPIS